MHDRQRQLQGDIEKGRERGHTAEYPLQRLMVQHILQCGRRHVLVISHSSSGSIPRVFSQVSSVDQDLEAAADVEAV